MPPLRTTATTSGPREVLPPPDGAAPSPPPPGRIVYLPAGQRRWDEVVRADGEPIGLLLHHGQDFRSLGWRALRPVARVGDGVTLVVPAQDGPGVDALAAMLRERFGPENVALYTRTLATDQALVSATQRVQVLTADGGLHTGSLKSVDNGAAAVEAARRTDAPVTAALATRVYSPAAVNPPPGPTPMAAEKPPVPHGLRPVNLALVDGGLVAFDVSASLLVPHLDVHPDLGGGSFAFTMPNLQATDLSFTRVRCHSFLYDDADGGAQTSKFDVDGHGTAMAGALIGDGSNWSGVGGPPPGDTSATLDVLCVGEANGRYGAAVQLFDRVTHGWTDRTRLVPEQVDGGFATLLAAAPNAELVVLPLAHVELHGVVAYGSLSHQIDTITDVTGKDLGVLVVTPAGNVDPGEPRHGLTAPGTARNAVTVGMSEPYCCGVRPSPASRGPVPGEWDARVLGIKPDFTVEGSAILPRAPHQFSYDPTGITGTGALGALRTDSYGTVAGTSVATARLGAYASRLASQGPRGAATTLKALLLHGVDLVAPTDPPTNGGWGNLDLSGAALGRLGDLYVYEGVLSPGKVATFGFVADGKRPVRVTLVWADRATPVATLVWQRTLELAVGPKQQLVGHPVTGPQVVELPGLVGPGRIGVTHNSPAFTGRARYTLVLSGGTPVGPQPWRKR